MADRGVFSRELGDGEGFCVRCGYPEREHVAGFCRECVVCGLGPMMMGVPIDHGVCQGILTQRGVFVSCMQAPLEAAAADGC